MSADLERLAAAVEAKLLARGGRERGDEIICRCPTPEHADEHPSCRYNRGKMAYVCDPCGASGGLLTGDRPLVPLLGLDPDDYNVNGGQRAQNRPGPRNTGSTAWEIRDREGTVIAVHRRCDARDGSKRVWWTGPKGEKKLAVKTADLPLYATDRFGEQEPGADTPVIICEGEPATDALLDLGLSAVGTVTGASSTPGPGPLEVLRGRDVVLWPDADNAGTKHMGRIAETLKDVSASVRTFEPKGLPAGGDAVEWLAAHNGADDLAGELLATIEAQAISAKPEQPTPPEFNVVDEGHYQLTFPDLGITFAVDRLRRERHQLQGELAVRCNLPGARTVDGVLSIGDMNLSSVQARATRAKYLGSRAQTEDVDWTLLLEEFTQRVLAAERAGEPAVMLRDLPRPGPDEALDIDGLQLLARHPVINFGDGGAAKSYLALYLAGRLEERGLRVGFFDWELAGEDHRERLELLFGNKMPGIRYARCTRPLVYEIDRLRRIVRDEGLGYVVLDSVAFACDGPPEAAEVAARYFQALRQLGPIGSLHVAHVAKALEGSDQKPFGSVFWHNGARATWNIKLAGTTPGDRAITIGLYNRKANLGAKRAAVGFEFTFATEKTWVRRVDLADVEDLAAALPVAERMRLLLRNGPMSIAAIAEEINTTANTVRSTVRRKPKLFVGVSGADGGHVISLLERRAG